MRLLPRRRRLAALRSGLLALASTAALLVWWSSAPPRTARPEGDGEVPENALEREEALLERRRVDEVLREALGRVVPGAGDNGVAVTLPPGPRRERAERLISTEAFNVVVSDMIGYHRTVPDNRHPDCRNVEYDAALPAASIVIIFTNESFSALLRTVHSVFAKSPERLLHEVILYDDFSERPMLKKPLERYIELNFPKKLKLLRAPRRHGLIRARLEGARAATGQVIVFLDSHCECNSGWLEPLVQRIKDDRKVAAVPIIEVIDDKTLQYMGGSSTFFQVGSFTWSGHFTWINIPEKELKRRKTEISPTRSATMAGGLFAMDRNYFWEIGGYDDGMDVWGGENLELSFRVWMCGGSLETIPCSRVGHIFRSFHPYTFPGNKDTHGINTVRMAEVWMDDYKRLFYLHRADLKNVNYGDIGTRKHLRRKLGCQSFQWFLRNIATDKFILDEDSLAYGRVKNGMNNICLDHLQQENEEAYPVGLYGCHDVLTDSQFWGLSVKHQLRREDMCAEASSDSSATEVVYMKQCDDAKTNQKWNLTPKEQLKHTVSGRCLDRLNGTMMDKVHIGKCNALPSQTWAFDKHRQR